MSDKQQEGIDNAVGGIVEGVKGKAKQVAGVVTGDDNLEREGAAQRDRAESLGEAAKHEAQAEKARREADVHEARERSHQD